MTVVTMAGISKIHKASEQESQQQSRYLTDKSGFRVWVYMVLAYLACWLGYKISSVNDLQKQKHETWESDAIHVNSSDEAISKIVASINNTIHLLNDVKSLKNICVGNIIGLVKTLSWIVITYLFAIRIEVPKIRDIGRKTKGSSGLEYTYHYTMCNIIRTISIFTLFAMLNYLLPSDETGQHYEIIFLFLPMEFMMLYLNLIMCIDFFFGSQAKEIGIRVLKFYFARRKLIFFQILNSMTMLLIATGVIVIMNVYCDNDPVIYVTALMGIFFFVINLMHTYAKMVIMLATASCNWDEEKGGVSWRSILSSMGIIGRYHMGSLIWYLPFLEILHFSDDISDSQTSDKKEGVSEKLDKEEGVCKTNNEEKGVCETADEKEGVSETTIEHTEDKIFTTPKLTYMMECTEIIIAVYGRSILEARDIFCQSKIKQRIRSDYKCTTMTAWTDIMIFMLPMLVYSIALAPVPSVEKLMSIVIISLSYLLVNGMLYYVFIKPINIAEFTIQFCKTITKEDLEIMESEQCTTNECEPNSAQV